MAKELITVPEFKDERTGEILCVGESISPFDFSDAGVRHWCCASKELKITRIRFGKLWGDKEDMYIFQLDDLLEFPAEKILKHFKKAA